MPTRTLQNWCSDGNLLPTVPVEFGIPRPIYSAGDLLSARVLWDLGEEGLPRSIVSQVAADLHAWRAVDAPSGLIDVRGVAATGWVLMIPKDTELAAFAAEEFPDDGVISFHEAGFEPSHVGDLVIVYPLSDVAAGLVKRIDLWWGKVGSKPDRRPPWM